MPLPVTFGSLSGQIPLSDLDTMFAAVALLGVIPCTVAGTNTLTLTPTTSPATPTVSSYQNYMAFAGIAANANTGAVTAAVASLAAYPVYKDTGSGPAALSGTEIQPNNLIILYYDSSLNSSAGGFHLYTTAITAGAGISTIIAGTGLSGGTITTSGTISMAQIANLRVMGNISGSNAAPTPQTLTALFDSMIGSVQYGYAQRGASTWGEVGGLAPAVSAAGSTQGTATQLAAQFNNVTTVGSSQGVILAATLALPQTVWNNGANTLSVYPPSGAQINSLGTNTADTIATSSYKTYVMISSSQALNMT